MVKLTDQQVVEIRDRVRLGERQYAVAERFDITQAYVSHIVNGRRRASAKAP